MVQSGCWGHASAVCWVWVGVGSGLWGRRSPAAHLQRLVRNQAHGRETREKDGAGRARSRRGAARPGTGTKDGDSWSTSSKRGDRDRQAPSRQRELAWASQPAAPHRAAAPGARQLDGCPGSAPWGGRGVREGGRAAASRRRASGLVGPSRRLEVEVPVLADHQGGHLLHGVPARGRGRGNREGRARRLAGWVPSRQRGAPHHSPAVRAEGGQPSIQHPASLTCPASCGR